MGRIWTEEMERMREERHEATGTWELLHEETGFEDVEPFIDHDISDLDGAETHMHFHTADPSHPKGVKH